MSGNRPNRGERAGRGRRGRRGGFSIVELVIVASVIAVAAAIALPRYSASVTRYRLDTAARRIAADLERARTAARISSTNRTVSFKPLSVAYTVSNESGLRRRSDGYEVMLAQEPFRVQGLTANFGGAQSVTFTPLGAVSSGGTITVRIGASQRSIAVNETTGKADIQ